jgi:hypothetical protein
MTRSPGPGGTATLSLPAGDTRPAWRRVNITPPSAPAGSSSASPRSSPAPACSLPPGLSWPWCWRRCSSRPASILPSPACSGTAPRTGSSATCHARCEAPDDNPARSRRHRPGGSRRPGWPRRPPLDDDRLLHPDACDRHRARRHRDRQHHFPVHRHRVHGDDGDDDAGYGARRRRPLVTRPGRWPATGHGSGRPSVPVAARARAAVPACQAGPLRSCPAPGTYHRAWGRQPVRGSGPG